MNSHIQLATADALSDLPPPPEVGSLYPDLRKDAHQLFQRTFGVDRTGFPRLYLDVDGVLVEEYGNPKGLQLRAGAGSFLRFVTEHFEVIWCTAWKQEANLLLPALVGFPHEGFAFKALAWRGSKADAILKHEGTSRFWVWVDDESKAHDRNALKKAGVFENLILAAPSKPLSHVTWKIKQRIKRP